VGLTVGNFRNLSFNGRFRGLNHQGGFCIFGFRFRCPFKKLDLLGF
jgi:hypothetical protein